jgi:hypothetical protein
MSMVYVTDNSSASVLARLGNQDGAHAGEVDVRFPASDGGRAASRDITVTPEGVYGKLLDGRQFFVSSGGLTMVDATPADGQPDQRG